MEKTMPNFYPREFKWKVVKEALTGDTSKEELRRKYGIKGKSAILNWMRAFGKIDYIVPGHNINNQKLETVKAKSAGQKRIEQLEKELELARIRVDLWEKVVELAGNEIGVDLRKKYGAKQSVPSKNKETKK